MTTPSVSVCLPAYNEQASIGEVLDEADRLLRNGRIEYEILVCDDGSRDATAAIIAAASQRIPGLRVLTNPSNMGIHYTFERLYRSATKDFVFLNSTDRQWPTQCLFDLLALADRHDIIVARRKNKHYGAARAAVSLGFNLLPRLAFGVETYDAGAVKLVRREIIERFGLVARSPFSEAERMIRAAGAGYRITAVDVETHPRTAGASSGASPRIVALALRDAAKLWLELRRQATAP